MGELKGTASRKMATVSTSTERIVGIAIMTAIVIVLQMLGSFIKFGAFSISLVSLPIVIGAVLYGAGAGAWLGFVFGMVVLISGDAAAFLSISIFGTVFTVLVKGALSGAAAGLVYRLLRGVNETVGCIVAALVQPIVNTGVFLLGCLLFFLPTVQAWGEAAGYNNVGKFMIVGFVGLNFLVELAVTIVLCPVVTRLVQIRKNM